MLLQKELLYKKIMYICKFEYKYFLKKKNVVGLGLGYKIIKGFYTKELCIKIFVCKKEKLDNLLIKDRIYMLYKGIKTDVVESGNFTVSSLTRRIRPVLGGYSIGAEEIKENGSFGCLVTDGEKVYILSNNHVLADENRLSIGTNIIQPGDLDGGKVPNDIIGTLFKYIPLKFQIDKDDFENYVDCAIAKVSNTSIVSSKIAFIGILKGITEGTLKEKVVKVGRTTEESYGEISSLGVTLEVRFNRGLLLFKNQIVTSKMTQTGDSGSVLMNGSKYVIGLSMADTLSTSVFNPINTVLTSLGVTIITK